MYERHITVSERETGHVIDEDWVFGKSASRADIAAQAVIADLREMYGPLVEITTISRREPVRLSPREFSYEHLATC